MTSSRSAAVRSRLLPRSLLTTFVLLAGARLAAAATEPCALAPEEQSWLAGALAAWERVSTEALGQPRLASPWLVFFDARCSWNGLPAGTVPTAGARGVDLTVGESTLTLHGAPHGGAVRLPTGEAIPPQLTTFAGTYGADEQPFFVFALPSVWRQTPRHRDEPGLDRLMRCVFAHEMTHTRQARSYGRRVGEVALANGLQDFDDDVIQDTFGADPAFAAAFERERELLYAAVAAADPRVRRELAGQALVAMRARRASAFSGPRAFYAELEDLFLSMEGVANWVGYQVALAEGAAPDEALAVMRRGGRHWSQDEGLALFLVIDGLLPGWQTREFGPVPASVLDLLAVAIAPVPGDGPRAAAEGRPRR